ncbi:FecR family protein [Maridesulfovibrio bastinii]|uniref:FecR family protein n=1 Tax=Maridesulfovibrio bastinii TaxID=47157 RepID=UPI000413582C|nr:FecR family protein [Maridesulfovibrio bastinii]
MVKVISCTLCSAILILAVTVSLSYAAYFEELQGKVELQRTGQDFFVTAVLGQKISPGDVIKTGADGKALIHLDDGSSISFSDNSEFVLGDELEQDKSIIGTILRGAFRAIFVKQKGSRLGTPTGYVGIRGTDITVTQNGEAGFYFLDEGRVDVHIEKNSSPLEAGQMTAAYAGRNPLPPFSFNESSGLLKAHEKLKNITSIAIPPSLKERSQLNEILVRWIINYSHYLADAGRHHDAETALMIAKEITEDKNVEGEILLQIASLYFYYRNDAKEALKIYDKIIEEYTHNPKYENALYCAVRCSLLLGKQAKAKGYADIYRHRYPHGQHIQSVESLTE